jgi:pyruvate-formate lyase-activating enzyme
MIDRASPFCDLFKIGLKAGDKHHYDLVRSFMDDVLDILETQKIYFKDSLLKQAAVRRDELPENCVGRDYNMFLEE